MDFLGGRIRLRALRPAAARAAAIAFALAALRAAPGACAARTRAAAEPPAMGVAALARRLDASWARVRTFQANLSWPNPESSLPEQQGCGLFLYQKPDRWLIEFHTPRFEKYVIRGDEAWVIISRLKQAMHSHLKPEERAQVGLLVLGQTSSALQRFYRLSADLRPDDRSAMDAGRPALVLTPREPGRVAVQRAVLFLDPATYLPRKVRLQLTSGEDLRMTLSHVARNGHLDASVWNVMVPDSVRTIEQQ